jgi:hypothetical protein
MMLKPSSGAIVTGVGAASSGASQASSSSSITTRAAIACPASAAALAASRKTRSAPESAIMPAICSGVADGWIGAATEPARSVPRNTAACATEG